MMMSLRKTSLLLSIACFLILAPLTSSAQTSLGILVGVIRDQSGAVIPKVTVTVTGNEDGIARTVVTQGDGAYRIEALRPETYTVTVNQASFSPFTAKNVIVSPSQTTTYDVNLVVGSANQAVSVEADSVAINTENGQLTGIVNTTDIKKLPIFSLSPFELATTVPGAQIVANSAFSNGQEVQVNGARPRANNYLIDSQEINDVSIAGQAFQPDIPDSFSNVSVLTSAASAEFGRAGGAVINSITKSGTNVYHGEVYERYTGSGLNALGGNERGTTIKKTRSDQHIYGFTAGGPFIKDKLFAFGGLAISRFYGRLTPSVLEFPDANGYALLQAIAAAAPSSSTPVVAKQVALLDSYLNSGISSGTYLNAYNPVTGRATVNTNVGPQPGCQSQPGGSCIITENFFQRPSPGASRPSTQWEYKIDYTPWEKDSFSARYLHARTSSNPDFTNSPGALIGFDTEQGGPSELGAGTWTHIFTSNLLNEFRVSETRINFAFAPTPQTLANPLYSLLSVNISGLPALGLNQNFPQGRGEDLYQFQDTVGFTKGRHSLRIGFDIGRQLEHDQVSQNAVGTLTFANGGTNAAGVSYTSALGNFLQNQLGPSGTATKTFGSTRIDPHNWRQGIFGQDDIKINGSVTINIGLRWDYLTNAENSLKYPGVDTHNPFGIITLQNGVATANAIKVNNPKNNFSPRLGFAYSPHFGGYFGDGKSVIRGGVGVFYDSSFSNIVTNSAQSSPNAVAATLTQPSGVGLANASTLVPTITPVLSLASSVTSVAANSVNPITYQYNLGVERQFPANIFFAVRYVGNIGSGLFANQQYNYFNGSTGQRLNPAYGPDTIRGNYARSRYDSLQVEGSHLFSHGFQIRGNYTWSKALDDASEIFTGNSDPTTSPSNLAFGALRSSNWGASDYDHRHYFVLTYVWSPAGFHGANGFADTALNVLTRNWTLSGSSRFQSGTYSTFAQNVDSNGDGSTVNDRPIIGNPSAPFATGAIDGSFVGGTPGVYYDIAAHNAVPAKLVPIDPSTVHFVVPHDLDNSQLKNEIGRNSFSNPGRILTDVALEKGFQVPKFERGAIVLRAEAQDIANHNNLNILNTTVNSIGNGAFQNKQNAKLDAGRQLILWAKFTF